jgi:hypothetical protein
MLQVEAMSLGNLAVHRLLDPSNLVNKTVAPLVEHIESKPVLIVDHPDEQETILLNLVQRDVQNVLVCQSAISDGNTSGGIS